MSHVVTIASISWDPTIRNMLSLAVGIVVLMGSVYLLLATNLGHRLGILVTLAGLFGWLTVMGVVWWMYGIGMKGEAAHWHVIEINIAPTSEAQTAVARTLPDPNKLPSADDVLATHPDLKAEFTPAPGEVKKPPTLSDLVEADPALVDELKLSDLLGGWELLVPSDPQRGDATATADAALGADGAKKFTDTSDYAVLDAFTIGGKPERGDSVCKPRVVHPKWSGCVDRVVHKISTIWHWRSPPHFAAVQVEQVIPQVTPPGGAPPPAQADPTKPVYTVIMERNLGDKRFPAAMVTLVFGTLFALTCNTLHRRDKAATLARAAAGA